MHRAILLYILTPLLIVEGCSLPARMSLSDIQPVRRYHASKEKLHETVRQYLTKENYNVTRFEVESGDIRAHKTLFLGQGNPQMRGASATRTLYMILKTRRIDDETTQLLANFGYADYQGSFTSEEEGMLVSEYNNLFSFLSDQFK